MAPPKGSQKGLKREATLDRISFTVREKEVAHFTVPEGRAAPLRASEEVPVNPNTSARGPKGSQTDPQSIPKEPQKATLPWTVFPSRCVKKGVG